MADRNVKPAFSLKETSGRWKIELVNLQKFDEVLTAGCPECILPLLCALRSADKHDQLHRCK